MRGWIALVALALVACGDAAAAGVNDVVERWKSAGLEVGELEELKEHDLGDANCHRTTVKGVETTLCKYISADAAKASHTAGLKAVGSTTGAALVNGDLLLIVADRKKADADGKTINQMTKGFMGK